MDRRKFLTVTGAAGVAAVWGGSLAGCAASANSSGSASGGSFPLSSVGLQLYTVRTLADKDLEGTMAAVAAAGYRLVETHTLYGKSPSELRAILDKHGLRTASGHYGLAELEGDPAKVFATANTLGQEFVMLNWLDPAHRTADFYKGFPAFLNKIGAQAKAAGLRFGHHNHDFEFDTLGGTTPVIDTVMANTDPALVSFEADLYWVNKANVDPLNFLERHAGRISEIHLKDSTPAPAKAMADVGAGVIDWAKILVAARRTGVKYAYVERDDTTAPLDTIKASRNYLGTLLAAK
jgi:sugar phosphate isomerase/epimerase